MKHIIHLVIQISKDMLPLMSFALLRRWTPASKIDIDLWLHAIRTIQDCLILVALQGLLQLIMLLVLIIMYIFLNIIMELVHTFLSNLGPILLSLFLAFLSQDHNLHKIHLFLEVGTQRSMPSLVPLTQIFSGHNQNPNGNMLFLKIGD